VIPGPRLPVVLGILSLAPRPAPAQGGVAVDSIAVEGHRRVSRQTIQLTSGLTPGRPLGYRDVQHAIEALYALAEFDDVQLEQQRTAEGRTILLIRVRERPLLVRWGLRGVERLPEGRVRDRVFVPEGRPLDPATVARSRAAIDSLYRTEGYYLAQVRSLIVPEGDSSRVRLIFAVEEGRRVAIARVEVEGNTRYPDDQVVGHLASRPEGFWWFRSGEYDDDQLAEDLQVRLPKAYGEDGFVDFQILDDTVVVNEATGKATLVIRVSEGDQYRVGSFEIAGNRRFSTDELTALYPFSGRQTPLFDQERWDEATNQVRSAYWNNGYIYAQVRPDVIRRTGPQGQSFVDLRWAIQEGQPAIVNKVEIVGNDITHERVIRDAIVLLPGDVFRQDAVIRSYQNISNLGFFNQPLPFPDTRPANDQGDVDVIFRVSERRTGNINFGASVGQGTGLGGFIGLEEPNLFGQGKRGTLQWQFGRNINDFNISYTDPAIRESRVSGTVRLYNTRVRYTIADVGRQTSRGGSVQFGFPFLGARYTRLFLSYTLSEQSFTGSSSNRPLRRAFACIDCLRSTLGVSVVRDTRIDLPFATAGALASVGIAQSGGPLGGTGNYQRFDLESRWYAPLGQMGGSPTSAPVKLVLGFGVRSGAVAGDAPFIEQLFTMGGIQYGIPLRGYEEFSITPNGFDPTAGSTSASPNAFGKAYLAMTGEIGARLSQMFYVSMFMDAGNVWTRARYFNPTNLFRGAGVGLALISPLGPLGLDYAYGFDRVTLTGRPIPGWKLHFKLGNFF
jgi:outer membrane protein insertion porin family